VYLLVKRRTEGGKGGFWELVGWDLVFPSEAREEKTMNGNGVGKEKEEEIERPRGKTLLKLLLQVSAFQTCASPIGFASLKYISYPMMVLAKVRPFPRRSPSLTWSSVVV
jgi:UDP-galactose transporter B1